MIHISSHVSSWVCKGDRFCLDEAGGRKAVSVRCFASLDVMALQLIPAVL